MPLIYKYALILLCKTERNEMIVAFIKRYAKSALFFLAGAALTLAVLSPFINTSKSNPVKTQQKPYTAITETYYTECGHTIISYDTTISRIEGTKKVVVNNYCPHHYLLKAVDGKVYVYRLANRNGEPIRTTEIVLDSLPDTERASLTAGIEVHSDEKLESLIEDYES